MREAGLATSALQGIGQEAPPVISLRDVHKSFRSGEVVTPVLDGVSLEVHPGEFVVIFGVSGSGKTTLLNLMGAIDRADRGSIRLDGEEIVGLSRNRLTEIRRRKIGYIFQFYNLLPTLTARENVEMGLELLGLERDLIRSRAADTLDRVGMKGMADKYPDQLSGGEQQRVAIARALAKKPGIVLADEPTGNLDEHTAAGVVRLMKELNTMTGNTFVVATHNRELAGAAHRVLRVTEGKLSV
jgi:putative ABC transport system ATP-binding protein